jgi:DNA polymerase-3 subunit alpha
MIGSKLDGLGKPDEYAQEAKRLGFHYLGCTDHGSIDGLIKFQNACNKQGIKTALGVESYIVPDVLRKEKEKRGHICIFVKNETGWEELCKLMSYANIEGFYYSPRIDYKSLLACDLSGFVISTACTSSFLCLPGGVDLLHSLIERGADVYLEIMPHDMPDQHKHNQFVKELHHETQLPMILTSDAHYVFDSDAKAHEVLLAIQRKAKWNDSSRWKLEINDLFLKSADQMMEAISKHDFSKIEIATAMRNTIKIAEKCCGFKINQREISLPSVVEGGDEGHFNALKEKTFKALDERVGYGEWDIHELNRNEYVKRLEYELDIIKQKKFSTYFLIVQDVVRFANERNILTSPGRGSAGGSLIAYLLGITRLDPIKHDLLFERFLSIDRKSYPDIDLDFEDTKRDQILAYLEDKYGPHHVAEVSTFSRMQARGVIRDVARVFDVNANEVDDFAKSISIYDDAGDDSLIMYTANKSAEGRQFYSKYKEIVDIACRLEGVVKTGGIHAAAIIIADHDLRYSDKCNLCMRSNRLVVNWEKEDAEYMGLMKLDVLGLKNLTVLQETKRLVEENGGETIVFDKIPLNDQKLFDELNKGNTVGVFQLNAFSSTEMVQQVGISKFEDIVDTLALVRPGPKDAGLSAAYIERKHGAKWEKKHPIYEEITAKTYGVTIFQESVLKVISEVAGLPYFVADQIRKVIGKKRDPKEFAPYWEMFRDGCEKQKTMTQSEAEEFWEFLLGCSRYLFNLSHSVGYAYLSCWTGYCKVHYPVEYLCACLTYGSKINIPETIDEVHRMGLKIIPPKLGISDAVKWVAKDNKLFVPFIEIKEVGEKKAAELASFYDKKNTLGFFNLEEIYATPTKKGSTMDRMLVDIGAYDKEKIPQEAQNYFEFNLFGDSRRTYPSLYNFVGQFDRNLAWKFNENIRDILNGKIIDFSKVIKKKRFRNKEVENCKSCYLRSEADRVVLPSMGKYNVMILGEAPGEGENRLGKGFVGRSGGTLWKELWKYNLERSMFHVSNCCKCFPSKTKTPDEKAITTCSIWWKEEVKELGTKLILALGSIPKLALTGDKKGISNLSGTTEWNEDLNSWICWCMHPASVLHNSSNKELFERGISNFASHLSFL